MRLMGCRSEQLAEPGHGQSRAGARRLVMLRAPASRWRRAVLICGAAVALVVPASALGAPGSRTASRAGLGGRVIPVWAYLNGARPVAGARVTILAEGRPVPQVGPGWAARTNASGVALVRVRRVPRRFTVVVRGGRVAGRRLRGSLQSLTRTGRAITVAEVNPLTTLVLQLRARRRHMGFGAASAKVKRYFGVPWWADLGQNLRDGPRWFNAGTYLRDVRRYGSINSLNRTLVHKILCGAIAVRRQPRTIGPRSAAAGDVRADAGTGAGGVVTTIFGELLKTAAKAGGGQIAGGVFGALISLARAGGIELPKNESARVTEQLKALGDQLTALKGQVESLSSTVKNSTFGDLFHRADTLTGIINNQIDKVQTLASSSDSLPSARQELADNIVTVNTNKLENEAAVNFFNNLLNPRFDLAGNPIKALSDALATSSRFFDARQSREVQAVYDYFADYQTRLAVLLTGVWNTLYAEPKAKEKIQTVHDNIEGQKASLKPMVPEGMFIDTRTPSLMWGTANKEISALTLFERGLEENRTQTIGDFHNYQSPSFNDLRRLVSDRTGENKNNPLAWLRDQVQVPLRHQLIWAHGSVRCGPGNSAATRRLEVRVFDLLTGKEEQYGYGNANWTFLISAARCTPTLLQADSKSFLDTKLGGLLQLRHIPKGESYWWGGRGG